MAGALLRDDAAGGFVFPFSLDLLGSQRLVDPVVGDFDLLFVGFLGVGKIVKRPVYDEHGQIKPADMLYLSFSFDHRVLDGAIGAAFGNAIIQELQNPARLLL